MEGTNLMRHRTKDRADRLGIERRTIRRYALEGQGPLRQSRLQTPQKGREIVMGGIVIEDGIENALVPPIVDGREHTILKRCTRSLSKPRSHEETMRCRFDPAP